MLYLLYIEKVWAGNADESLEFDDGPVNTFDVVLIKETEHNLSGINLHNSWQI